jgi:hypothetical protein
LAEAEYVRMHNVPRVSQGYSTLAHGDIDMDKRFTCSPQLFV